MTFHPFNSPRSIREYLGQSGAEIGGLALSPIAMDAHAASVTSGLPEELCVVGYDQAGDGPRRLRYEVTRAHIEATTNYRQRNDRLRWVCPACNLTDPHHTKGCELA